MEILVAVIIIVVLGVIAMYLSMQKKNTGEEPGMPIIHTSGIYSVIRKSPRENIAGAKPSAEALSLFVRAQDKDINGALLSDADKDAVLAHYKSRLEESISAVEQGDRQGVQRFQITAAPDCSPCRRFNTGRYFITREDIYRHPETLPPYYPGCTCRILPELERLFGDEMSHYKPVGGEFPLPSWKNIRKI